MPKAGRETLPSWGLSPSMAPPGSTKTEGQCWARNIFMYLVLPFLRAQDEDCSYMCATIFCCDVEVPQGIPGSKAPECQLFPTSWAPT